MSLSTEEGGKHVSTLLFLILAVFVVSFSSGSLFAWDGYDYERGAHIEIEKGNLVREGEDIEVYDYDGGSYRDVEVESIDRSGGSVEVEVYDRADGEYRTFEMED
jgi:hypothetical protein